MLVVSLRAQFFWRALPYFFCLPFHHDSNDKSTLAGIIIFTKNEAYAGMAERLVIDLMIEEALQEEIKYTL